MKKIDKKTRLNQACENFVMNLTFYRSWSQLGDDLKNISTKESQKTIFWKSAKNSFLDSALFYWRGIFIDTSSKHYFTNYIDEHEFKNRFYEKNHLSNHSQAFEYYLQQIKKLQVNDYTQLENLEDSTFKLLDTALNTILLLHDLVFPETNYMLVDYLNNQLTLANQEYKEFNLKH